MRQKAVVLETNGSIAKIKVFRSTMCEGCSKHTEGKTCACGELLGANRVMIAEASNEIGAQTGEAVEIETSTSVVLGYAALVFVLPIAAFFILYSVAEALSSDVYAPWIAGGSGFLLAFVPVMIAERMRRGKKPQLRIAARLHTESIPDEVQEE